MKKEIIFDIKAWLVVAFIMPFFITTGGSGNKLVFTSVIYFSIIAMFYPNKWLIKTYLSERQWLRYFFGVIVLISVVSIPVSFMLRNFGGENAQNYIGAFLISTLFLFLSVAFNYAYKGILLQIQYEKTKRRQVEAELKLLQSQVNPHFLFNTLNNIYSQNLNNHEEANEMILQMADLMRYQIESSKKNEVNIHDEIEFLENYIALEKHRVTDRIKVSFVVDNAENVDLTIPPMLFIPFIENAYKHGISAEGECFITIFLGIKSDSISFKTENTIPLRKQKVKSTNTGLENIKKRLDLLFPEKHRLDITTDNQTYKVQLDIKI